MWFTEAGVSSSPPFIGRITTDGVVTEFVLPTIGVVPTGITTGPDGNLWFAEQAGDAIGRITTAGVVTEFTAGITRPGAAPFGITTGPGGNLWFAEITGNRVGSITTGDLNHFIFVDGFDGP